MPKKGGEWHQLSTPTTPSQINYFFDMCTQWLVGTPSNEKFKSLETRNTYEMSQPFQTENFVFSILEVNDNTERKCFFCDETKNIKISTANPFTRKNQIFTCNRCFLD